MPLRLTLHGRGRNKGQQGMTARAQRPAMPVIGFLRQGSPESVALLLVAFRAGLREEGFSRARTSLSNIAGLKVRTIDCPHCWTILCNDR
jgi:hypothetical protein